jgi:hypothetical protein
VGRRDLAGIFIAREPLQTKLEHEHDLNRHQRK